MAIPMDETIPDNKAFLAVGFLFGTVVRLLKWSFIVLLLLGLIRALDPLGEQTAYFDWGSILQSSVVRWTAQNWPYLAISLLLLQNLRLGKEIALLSARSASQATFIYAFTSYIGADDVHFSRHLQRKGRGLGDLVAQTVSEWLLRSFFGRQQADDTLLTETRFVRAGREISLRGDILSLLQSDATRANT
jgi:hypothetical protein